MTDLSPPTVEEREKRLAWMNRMAAKPIIVDRVFERRLIADVKRLDAELHDSATNVLSLSASLGTKIERVSELEAENKRLRDYLIEIGADTGP